MAYIFDSPDDADDARRDRARPRAPQRPRPRSAQTVEIDAMDDAPRRPDLLALLTGGRHA